MRTIFADEPPYEIDHWPHKSIFLAGPTPRVQGVPSWRPEACQILESLGYDGVVMVPERKDWSVKFEYTDQIAWEQICLERAATIVFWVPRQLETMPAFTTNVEFGFWMGREARKVFYGRPDNAPKNLYLDVLYEHYAQRKPLNNLPDLMREASNVVLNSSGWAWNTPPVWIVSNEYDRTVAEN